MPTNQDEKNSNDTGDQQQDEKVTAKRVLIGSQRDAADPSLGTKAIRHAALSPDKINTAIQSSASPAVAEESVVAKAAALADAATVSESPVVTESPDIPAVAKVPEAAELSAASAVSSESVVEAAAEYAPVVMPGMGADDTNESIEAELEAALGDLKVDSLLGGEQPAPEIEIDSRVKAVVTRIHNDNVFFSLKGRFEGVASRRQFKSPPEEGAMMDVVVNGFKEDEGLFEVNIPGASVKVADWSDLVEGAVVETSVTGSNTGGLECWVNNIRGFIPASQIDIVRVENLGDYVNQRLQCVVVEVNEGKRKLILSRRAILERANQEKKEELLKTLAAGQTLDGIVTRLMDFGAFVDIGGVEGLVHVSKMSWDRVTHPKDILEPGQKISVKVEKISEDNSKISLSYRDTQGENPWKSVDQKYPEGAVVAGTVTRLAQFGAFVKLEPGIEGLIHISELAHHRVMAVKNVVSQGDSVQVKVLSVDPSAQKIGLSLKATLARPEKATDGKKGQEESEPLREAAIKKRDEPLKGGRDKGSGGDQFGLNW